MQGEIMITEQDIIDDEVYTDLEYDFAAEFKRSVKELSSENEISEQMAEKLYYRFIQKYLEG